MTPSRFRLVLAPVLGLALAACHAPAAATIPADPVAGAQAAAKAFDHAQLTGDRATLDRYLANDFVFVRGAGVVADRDAFLAGFSDPDVKLEPFAIEKPIAIRLADTAVIIGGETTLRGTEKGAPFAEHLRYADVFQLRDGRWQVVYVQVTLIK